MQHVHLLWRLYYFTAEAFHSVHVSLVYMRSYVVQCACVRMQSLNKELGEYADNTTTMKAFCCDKFDINFYPGPQPLSFI